MSIHIRVAGLVASAIVASAASAQTAVEWKVSEGGNGHWYEVSQEVQTWSTARQTAQAKGADLACFETTQELAWFRDRGFRAQDYLVGGRQLPNGGSPGEGWIWLTGVPLQDFQTYFDDNPCAAFPSVENNQQNYLHLGWNSSAFGDINDGLVPPCNDDGARRFIEEWSADCNNDGIVDYGQILRGELDDDNANGIPDICETSVTGVIPPSVPSQGGSTVTIKGANFPANPTVLIGGVPATDVVRLSATRITATSPALLPGMTSISVNGFTLPEALYIRPGCGSDLDQNGSVDAGDISIILLDFGPCYEPPAALAAPAPTPLLADEPAQKPTQR
jgi:hypothetical protein